MKNVTVTNGQMAKRAVIATLAILLVGFMVEQGKMNEANVTESPPAVSESLSPQAGPDAKVLFIASHMRGIYSYTSDECRNTSSHEVYIGMPEGQVVCQTGEPERENRSTNRYGTNVQYVFNGISGDTWYLYVTNGKVSSWHYTEK